jgi:hypothetical protein
MPFLLLIVMSTVSCKTKEPQPGVFRKDNLTAWCIVPYDLMERNPAQRAAMLSELGINKLAYDWRENHIPEWDEEWAQLNKHSIQLQGIWLMSGNQPESDPMVQAVFDFIERNQIQTEIWYWVYDWPGMDTLSQADRLAAFTENIRYMAERAASLGCKIGLYNHRSWSGEPENQLAVIENLQMDNVGIVYNFHHAHAHIDRFETFFPKIQPHVYSVNLAGLKKEDSEEFFLIGSGDAEARMISVVAKSGYSGPIGILNHSRERDAKEGLLAEMAGLKQVLQAIGDTVTAATYETK